MASLRFPLQTLLISVAFYSGRLKFIFLLIFIKTSTTFWSVGDGTLIKRHLLLIGCITLANDSQVRIILHLSIYFSIVLLKEA